MLTFVYITKLHNIHNLQFIYSVTIDFFDVFDLILCKINRLEIK